VLRLLRQGLVVMFRGDAVVVLNKQQHILARGVKEHGLFRIVQPPTADYSSGAPIYAFAALSAPSLSTWHQRFGHLSQQAIRWLAASQLVGGLELESGSREHLCDTCAAGKAHRLPFPASPSRSTALLDLVHSDLMQLNTPLLGGACYLFTLLDDHSKKLWVHFLKRKSDAFQHFREWQVLVERQSSLKVKALRSDNGGEYTAGQFQSRLHSERVFQTILSTWLSSQTLLRLLQRPLHLPLLQQLVLRLQHLHIALEHHQQLLQRLLRYGAHALLELGVLRLACGAGDGCWRGGVHGPGHIFAIFLPILLTALRLILRPVSPIGSFSASPSRPFWFLLLLIVLSHALAHFRTLEWTTNLPVVYKEALDHLGRSDPSDTV
jgi:hypothetical protein